MKLTLFCALVLICTVGCASAPKATTAGLDHAGEELILARIDGLSARPSYISEAQPFKIEGGMVSSLGETIIPADHSLPAAYRISANSAKVGISSAVQIRLESVFQNAEEGTDMASQARYIGSEVSKLTTGSIRISHNYWEKVAVIREDGRRDVQYRVFTVVTMPESDFKMAVMDAIRKGEGKNGLSEDFAKKVDENWSHITNQKLEQTTPQAAN